nr:gag pol polyprotein [Hymenolepis microstoma]
MSKETDLVVSLTSAPTERYKQAAASSFSHNIAIQFAEVVLKTPDKTSYDQLKEAVVKRFSVPKKKHFHQIFSQTELGDRSLTQLLQHMRSLASGYELQDEILKDNLSESVVSLVDISSYQDDFDKLAEVADRIYGRREIERNRCKNFSRRGYRCSAIGHPHGTIPKIAITPYHVATDGALLRLRAAASPQGMTTRSANTTEHTEIKPRNIGQDATTPGLTVLFPS